ncbi:MAG: HD-GYP domain-containing protein [Clostridiaceae bacterium]|jgi:HD-GYP domain-containing protein (c-di-GMP phosphodiesterase class II)|nr:HD-GYP domain-containing protein [Clostridiaceae bacterium]
MRYVPTTFLKADMVVGKDVYGRYGEVYLKRNTKLTLKYISQLEILGYLGIFIEDEISEGIEIKEIVNPRVRVEAINKVKDVYTAIKNNNKGILNNWKEIDQLTDNIISNILSNEDTVYNIMYMKTHDDYTYTHCVNVALIVAIVAKKTMMSKAILMDLFKSALMHDIGKLFIPLSILNKPGRLSTDEFELIKQHPLKGYDYLVEQGCLTTQGRRGVLMHHEYHNGKGYPFGISDAGINKYGKILCICDVYDALVSDRPYRKAWSQSEAFEYIMANTGSMFDPEIMKIFIDNITPYNPGTIIQLSNSAKAIVVKNNKGLPLRPIIRIFEEDGNKVPFRDIDLKEDSDYLNIVIDKEINY